ncbi:hypothetical protein BOX15_Mlig014056g1, partial [Macrostomum lignano]
VHSLKPQAASFCQLLGKRETIRRLVKVFAAMSSMYKRTKPEVPTTQEHEEVLNVNVCRPISQKKRAAFNEALVSLINAKRREFLGPLVQLNEQLCKIAEKAWNVSAKQPHGLVAMPYNQFLAPDYTGKANSDSGEGKFYDCLSYTDNVIRSKRELPEAAVHFWTTCGRYTSRPGKRALPQSYPPIDETFRAELEKCRGSFFLILAGQWKFSANRRIGVRQLQLSYLIYIILGHVF